MSGKMPKWRYGTGSKDYTLICEAFEESELPFRADVVDYNDITYGFREIINEGYEVIM